MDPAMMQMLMTLVTSAVSGMGGKNEEHGSTYSKPAQGLFEDIISQLKGGAPNIQQDQGYQQGQNWLQSMFNDPEFFNSFEAPLQRQFNEQTVPDLANRFAGMGSGGSLGSTGFRNQLAREGSNLSTNIAALRGGMQQNAIPQMLGYAQQPFQNYMTMANQALQPTENKYQGPSTGFFGPILSALTGGAAQGYGQKWGENMAGGGGNQLSTATGRQWSNPNAMGAY